LPDGEQIVLFNETNQLLEPGYLPLETGYYRLSNGQMHVAVLTLMNRCKGEMIDWWFGYLADTDTFRMWHPKGHISLEWDEHYRPGHYIGASQIVEGEFGGPVTRLRIHYHDPSEFLDISKFSIANVAAAICANVYDLEKVPLSRFIHLVRDTESGCEVRSRFWLFRASEADAITLIKHALEEMHSLGVFLPDLYDREYARHKSRAAG
jgi:hypothetical protein